MTWYSAFEPAKYLSWLNTARKRWNVCPQGVMNLQDTYPQTKYSDPEFQQSPILFNKSTWIAAEEDSVSHAQVTSCHHHDNWLGAKHLDVSILDLQLANSLTQLCFINCTGKCYFYTASHVTTVWKVFFLIYFPESQGNECAAKYQLFCFWTFVTRFQVDFPGWVNMPRGSVRLESIKHLGQENQSYDFSAEGKVSTQMYLFLALFERASSHINVKCLLIPCTRL